MKHPQRIGTWLLLASIGIAAAQAAAPAGDKARTSYKWVDQNGVTHYGDGIPPEAAQSDAKVLNRNAIAVREVPAPKTAGQEDDRRQSEAVIAKQKQHDRFLLTTYTSLRDIEQLRDERVTQISNQVTLTQGYIETVTQRLKTLKMRAANFKPYAVSQDALRMPDSLAAELVQAINEERQQRDYLAKREQEIETTRENFQADIDRYRQLTGK